MEKIRLQKYLSQLGVASRREVEAWIQKGLVTVNGTVPNLGYCVDPEKDVISLNGKNIVLKAPPKVYWLLNKPDKILTTRHDERGRATIYDLDCLKNISFRVNPIGRLDYRTEGLLLLSNDGEMIHRLCHPSFKIPRHYQVLVSGKLSEKDMRSLRQGVMLPDGLAKCEIQYAHGKNLGKSKGSFYFISVTEGRNRLVRRLIEFFGFKVIRLVRYGFGDIRLDIDLAPGEYRQLTKQEISYLKEVTQMSLNS